MPLAAPLVCPSCLSPLAQNGAQARCEGKGCGRSFPLIGDLPCLVPDPPAWLGSWLQQLDLHERAVGIEAAAITADMKSATLEGTRVRLDRLLKAKQAQRGAIETILAPLAKARKKAIPHGFDLGQRSQPSQTLLYHYVNILRDWAWGEDENRAASTLVLEAAGRPPSLGVCAVLGAGACRLASDLHRADAAATVLALDLNPLLLFAAKRVLEGAPLELPEFPLSPVSAESVGITHSCESAARLDSRLKLVIADVLSPPLQPGALDTVVTPWLVDVIPQDARVLLNQANRLLKPGGRWIHFGPLGFMHPRAAFNYGPGEFEELAGSCGFEIVFSRWDSQPYLMSPHKGERRHERVLCLSAKKVAEASEPRASSFLPEWIADPRLPVPVSPELAVPAQSLQRVVEILGLVDGKRSISEISGIVSAHYGLDQETVEGQVKNIFSGLLGIVTG